MNVYVVIWKTNNQVKGVFGTLERANIYIKDQDNHPSEYAIELHELVCPTYEQLLTKKVEVEQEMDELVDRIAELECDLNYEEDGVTLRKDLTYRSFASSRKRYAVLLKEYGEILRKLH